MKSLLRVFVFTAISLIVTQKLLNGFSFGVNEVNTLLLVIIGLSLLNLLLGPVFKLISLPSEGIGFILLSFLLSLAVLFVLTLFIPSFSAQSGDVGDLLIYGLVIPSKSLPITWSFGLSALVFTLIYRFFIWLGSKK